MTTRTLSLPAVIAQPNEYSCGAAALWILICRWWLLASESSTPHSLAQLVFGRLAAAGDDPVERLARWSGAARGRGATWQGLMVAAKRAGFEAWAAAADDIHGHALAATVPCLARLHCRGGHFVTVIAADPRHTRLRLLVADPAKGGRLQWRGEDWARRNWTGELLLLVGLLTPRPGATFTPLAGATR